MELRRSRLVWNLIELMQEGAITFGDLEGFIERVRLTVEHFAKALAEGHAGNSCL